MVPLLYSDQNIQLKLRNSNIRLQQVGGPGVQFAQNRTLVSPRYCNYLSIRNLSLLSIRF